tara:strand:+ start:59 stop:190 length:132 start_codon:yes stop_codon:yes gene_type:complete
LSFPILAVVKNKALKKRVFVNKIAGMGNFINSKTNCIKTEIRR